MKTKFLAPIIATLTTLFAGCASYVALTTVSVVPNVPLFNVSDPILFAVFDNRPYISYKRMPPEYIGHVDTYGLRAAMTTVSATSLTGEISKSLVEAAKVKGAKADILPMVNYEGFTMSYEQFVLAADNADKLLDEVAKAEIPNVPKKSRLQDVAKKESSMVVFVTINDWRFEFIPFKQPNFYMYCNVDVIVVSARGDILSERGFRNRFERKYSNAVNNRTLQQSSFSLTLDYIFADAGLAKALNGEVDSRPYNAISDEDKRQSRESMRKYNLIGDNTNDGPTLKSGPAKRR